MAKHFKFIKSIFCLTILFLGLTACHVVDPQLNANNDAITKALQNDITLSKKSGLHNKTQIPVAIQKALMPEINTNVLPPPLPDDQQRFNIAVNNVPAPSFFMGLVKGTKYNMTVNSQVSGMISLDLKNVTIPEVLDTVRQVYGYEYESTPQGYQILPRKIVTRIYTVNYLDIERGGNSNTSFGAGELTNIKNQSNSSNASGLTRRQEMAPSGTVETSSKANFWKSLKENLVSIIGTENGRNVVVNSQAGVVIVTAYPDELRNIASYLDDIQNSMNRQVIIEAQILEIELNAGFQTGVNWKLLGLRQGESSRYNNSNEPTLEGLSELPNKFANVFTLDATDGNSFASFIQLLSTQGRVNVLSSPRISTTNNQKAVIKVGQDRFFVTNVSSNTTNTAIGTSTNTSQNIDLTPFFSGIALDVTPQINERSEVTLHIHPSISKVTLDRQQFKVNSQEQDLPLAQSSIRETDSVVRAKNGQIIVIGGLMENESSEYTASTPGTEHLGPFRALFKSSKKSSRKLELVILLRPIVVNNNYNWTPYLQETADRAKSMKQDFRYSITKD